MNNIGHWLSLAIEKLRANAEIESPVLDAQLLACHELGVSRTYLFAYPETQLHPSVQRRLDDALARRIDGEPIAYITGYREFWSGQLKVEPGVLVPRPDTETLVEKAIQLIPAAPSGYLADLGTGTCAIALAIAGEFPSRQILAVERSTNALRVAKANIEARDAASNVHLIGGSWLSALADDSIAMVLANPPYLAADDPHLAQLRHEPLEALVSGDTGLEDLEQIIKDTLRVGKKGAPLIMEHGYEQADSVRQLLNDYNYTGIKTAQDIAGLDRISFGFVAKQ